MENVMRNEAYKILEYLQDNGIINIEDAEQEMRRKEIQHTLFVLHSYKFFKGKDGRWRTYVKTDKGRKLVVKTRREDLEDYIYELYRKENRKNLTIKELYPEWLEYKALHTDAPTYIYRIERFWKKYYISDSIISEPISNLDKIYLDKWAHGVLKKYGLTKKLYYNITLIIRQVLDYAVETGIIEHNYYNDVKIDKRMFKPTLKKPSSEEVFSINELYSFKQHAMESFSLGRHTKQPLVPLAILFQLQTGIRLGELRALTEEDISEDMVSITKFVRSEPGEIVNHTKGTYGDRSIFLTEEAKKLIALAINKKEELGIESPFIFSITDKPLSSSAIDKAYYKYCDELGFFRKSSHKARKTVISSLIDSGMNINTIREIAGHKDERTTYNSYCYDRNDNSTNIRLMNDALK